jgi:hypothetical protein
MATNTLVTIGNIYDVLKFKLPNGSAVDNVVNTLVEFDDFSKYVPAFPANNGLTHHGLRTIQLPTGYYVNVGGSWKSSKSEYEPFVEALATIRSTYQAPKDTFTTEKAEIGQARLRSEKSNHITMMNQAVTNMLIGESAAEPKGVAGLMNRAPWNVLDNSFTFGYGGTGTDLRSCWLMKPGLNTIHTLYNGNHPTLGVEMEDKGEQLVDGLGDNSDEHRWDIMIEFMVQKGICINDMTAVKRICNVPCGTSDAPGQDLIDLIIEASIINAPKAAIMEATVNGSVTEMAAPWLLFCDERLYAKLVIAANNKLFVYQSEDNIYRTRLPMIGANIIILRMDALNHAIGSGETEVS